MAEIKDEKILEASKTCPEAKLVLQTLFPEVFGSALEFEDFELMRGIGEDDAVILKLKNNHSSQMIAITKQGTFRKIGHIDDSRIQTTKENSRIVESYY